MQNPQLNNIKNHKPGCQCVKCRLSRGEKPNPNLTKTGSRSRNYLWVNDALDAEITTAAVRTGKSKSQIVREGIIMWLEKFRGSEEDVDLGTLFE